jgi:uncharacterized protein YjiS (DUF1127 family)
MANETGHGEFNNRINDASLRPTKVSLLLCAASNLFQKLAQWHTRSTLARQARQELQALSDTELKDIGLHRGDIGNLADDIASKAGQCR